jgi:uncharacterized protein (TIGR00299 family) protein
MTIAYFDCFTGAAGDMIVAGLLSAGASFPALENELAKLKLPWVDIRFEPVVLNGISCSRFSVVPDPQAQQPHRHLGDILELIDTAKLAPGAAERARRIFTRLAAAEAKVHSCDIQAVHFHEVGAVDSIVDIVGAAVAMELLGIDKLFCSAIPLGSGTLTCQHGTLPIPAPATAELLIGVQTCPGPAGCTGELTTPTAAAIFAELAEGFGPTPPMEISAVGYGAGTRRFADLPNALRVILGKPDPAGQVDSVVELAANIDDCTGEVLGATIEKLISSGCLDAWASPVFTKKSRPAWLLCALCKPADQAQAQRIIFTETTTLGIRARTSSRAKLSRTVETVETSFGPIRVKLGWLDGKAITVSPEFTDCQAGADAHHVPVGEVIAQARRLWQGGAV